jgi:hypothetical protein
VSEIYAALRDYFASAGTFDEHEEDGWVAAPGHGSNGAWLLIGQAYDALDAAVIYGVVPERVPADRRAAVAELVTRINYGLILGSFELDLDDGEVRFKASLARAAPTRAELTPLVITVHAQLDRWLPALSAVADGAAPAEAFARELG